MPNLPLILKQLQALPHLKIMIATLSSIFFLTLWMSDWVWGGMLKRERERINTPVSPQQKKWGLIMVSIVYFLLGYGVAFFFKDKVLTRKLIFLLLKKGGLRLLLISLFVMILNWLDDGRSVKVVLVERTGGLLSLILLSTVMCLLGVIQLG